jgi:hypothetical protein
VAARVPRVTTTIDTWIHALSLLIERGLVDLMLLYLIFTIGLVVMFTIVQGKISDLLKFWFSLFSS